MITQLAQVFVCQGGDLFLSRTLQVVGKAPDVGLKNPLQCFPSCGRKAQRGMCSYTSRSAFVQMQLALFSSVFRGFGR